MIRWARVYTVVVVWAGSLILVGSGATMQSTQSVRPLSSCGGGMQVAPDTLVPTTFPFGPCPEAAARAWQVGDGPVSLDRRAARRGGLIDVRGVGDAGMAVTYEHPSPPTHRLPNGGRASFGYWLDSLDATGLAVRGDLSFINWESVVGTGCTEFQGEPGPRSYAFVSHPENLVEAYRRGFNLIGLANNHSQDCVRGTEEDAGTQMSARHMERLGRSIPADWLWHGVGRTDSARVRTMEVGGRTVRVAFASLYMAQKPCPYAACGAEQDDVLSSLEAAEADLRILSLHSWNEATQKKLVETGETFLREYKGDIVFGHGPHIWKPVRVIESSTGHRGVLFESLGNFLHPSLATQPRNLIGRVLLDAETLGLRQVQAIGVSTDGVNGRFTGAPSPTEVPTNQTWIPVQDSTWRSGINAAIRGAYFSMEP